MTRAKIIHYRQLYLNRPDPIVFMPVTVDTSGRIYDDFSRLLFLHAHREASALTTELPEVSDQFRFLHTTCLSNLKESVGWGRSGLITEMRPGLLTSDRHQDSSQR